MIKAISVIGNDDYSIVVTLEDGRVIRMDMSFVKTLHGPVADPLKDLNEFKNVFIRNGIVTWATGYDVDPYHLIEQGTVVKKIA
ncbi:MAG: DUF2442 domain-containing protein [Deltaproteobacteria bacterium]|nr:DUF2442 domain-containing protein [Deltaproteobacteria bacterium]